MFPKRPRLTAFSGTVWAQFLAPPPLSLGIRSQPLQQFDAQLVHAAASLSLLMYWPLLPDVPNVLV